MRAAGNHGGTAGRHGDPCRLGDRPTYGMLPGKGLRRLGWTKRGKAAAMTGRSNHRPQEFPPVSILSPGPPANTADPRFYPLPWHDDHPNKRDIERRLEPGHCARLIDQAVARLDLSALRQSYGGTGSQAHPPEQLLRAVLYEVRNGYHCPAQWYR